jgi:LemA protein
MRKLLLVLITFLILAGIIGAYLVGKYNHMVLLKADVAQQQAQVEVQIQRRYDLIPNLVESVKGYLKQEQTVFKNIADARAHYANAKAGTPEKVEASNELESAISRLLVIVENYPELKSDETVKSLMYELSGTENRIAVERRKYNEIITEYNKYISIFPNNIIAKLFHFEQLPRFETTPEGKQAPKVNLDVTK